MSEVERIKKLAQWNRAEGNEAAAQQLEALAERLAVLAERRAS